MNVMDSFSLQGKVVLLVGGSGRYGRQITRALVQAGATAYVTTRDKNKMKELTLQFQEEGLSPTVIYMDQSKEKSILELRDQLMKKHGKLDVLVNNAVARPMKEWNSDTALFAESMAVNATGIYSVTKIFGNVMEQQKSGSIINIGSIHGMIGPDDGLYKGLEFHGFVPDYFFHKGGMINFTKFTASYYGKSNVRCNCISPGGILSSVTPPLFVERYSERTMLCRMANDTDLMGIIVFLASDASLYITGSNIPVDGGYTAK